MKRVIPAGEVKYLTVDVTTLRANQALHRQSPAQDTGQEKPPCWVQIGDDKQNKINCWNIYWNMTGDRYAKMIYGHPRICGAMVYVETDAELELEI